VIRPTACKSRRCDLFQAGRFRFALRPDGIERAPPGGQRSMCALPRAQLSSSAASSSISKHSGPHLAGISVVAERCRPLDGESYPLIFHPQPATTAAAVTLRTASPGGPIALKNRQAGTSTVLRLGSSRAGDGRQCEGAFRCDEHTTQIQVRHLRQRTAQPGDLAIGQDHLPAQQRGLLGRRAY